MNLIMKCIVFCFKIGFSHSTVQLVPTLFIITQMSERVFDSPFVNWLPESIDINNLNAASSLSHEICHILSILTALKPHLPNRNVLLLRCINRQGGTHPYGLTRRPSASNNTIFWALFY